MVEGGVISSTDLPKKGRSGSESLVVDGAVAPVRQIVLPTAVLAVGRTAASAP
ncbi:MAG: hypothetical protein HN742_36275 [Lentisphaerae bacterium]|nr:hypothetical protein [Lentisphaerota bacterium]MBT4817909.1 hypothetical protein [Lentisphaerota bacterium]MBT5607694.1 hypothetical protein [Lentisphaerota bacterium]MBT7061295.1 hypothetical protein [Lentisphaerota bacterium]MBT7847384.1 hypothetical protein [Lentisphaerota bacterium]